LSNGYYQLDTGRVAAIDGDCEFPLLKQALSEPNGLLAIGGDLSAARLLSAYKQGIFPWTNYNPLSEGDPICWYSPNPRMVLFPNELKISKSLAKNIKKYTFETRINTAFQAVITACSKTPRPNKIDPEINGDVAGTWLSPAMITAYCELHKQGFAVSSETWLIGEEGSELVGGCYGVKIGCMFYGESMFHTRTDASKIAFVNLVEWLKNQQVGLIDCQMKTPLLESFGGREISRDEFSQMLTKLIHC
jgi:leucyl/phenylalanyl-tRNA---protein transferase